MSVSFLGESPEYRAARDRLLDREIELRRLTESVAAERRRLPPGPVVREDYLFRGQGADGNALDVHFSDLFAPNKNSLVVYNMMFPRDRDDVRPGPKTGETAKLPLEVGPCPSCAALVDQLEGAAEHLLPRINCVIVSAAPIERMTTFAKDRGWKRLRLLSSLGTTFKNDYFGETAVGDQRPMLQVFQRDPETKDIRLFWSSELLYAPPEPGQDTRHVGTIEPLWNVFDMIPEGRGADWDEQLDYEAAAMMALPSTAFCRREGA